MATDQISGTVLSQVAVCVTAEGAGGGAEGLFWWVTLVPMASLKIQLRRVAVLRVCVFQAQVTSPEIDIVNVYDMDSSGWADRFHLDTEGTDWIWLEGKISR